MLSRRFVLLVIFCFIVGIAFFAWREALSRSANLRVAFLDVGQGDAALILFPGGTQILIDGGPNKSILQELSRVMPPSDKTIELMVMTHPDADHITGLLSVLEAYDVQRVLETGVRRDVAVSLAWEDLLVEERAQIITVEQPMRLEIGKYAVLDVLWPQESVRGKIKDTTNDTSIVARLQYGSTSFLFTGDIESPTESKLVVCCKTILDSDALKVAHHGSKTSSLPQFLEAVTPTFGVFSVGADNQYGHPAPVILERLLSAGAKILRTDEHGTVIVESDGRALFLK